VVTVCDSIARDIEQEFPTGKSVEVIRNIPEIVEKEGRSTDIRTLCHLPPETFVFLWQGGLGPTRLLEPIIEAMCMVEGGVLVIRGPGIDAYRKEYLGIAKAGGFLDRVFCLPPVPSRSVVAEARSADVGVWSLPNLGKNFYYSLPNKIFEYLAAGLPIMGAAFPEVKGIIERYSVGATFDPYDSDSIAQSMSRFIVEPEFNSRCRQNVGEALASLNAKDEWRRLVRIYDSLENGNRQTDVPYAVGSENQPVPRGGAPEGMA
jgi:glycosyltransferase involved in cell wall biosynthesis